MHVSITEDSNILCMFPWIKPMSRQHLLWFVGCLFMQLREQQLCLFNMEV